MTEQEWLTSTDPQPMLEFLRGKASDRKLRLFACAYCRRIWDSLPKDACQKAVEIAERYADGQAANRELSSAYSAVVASAEEEGITLFDPYEMESIEWGTIPGGLAFLAITELLREREFEAADIASHAALEVAWDARRLRMGKEAARLAFENDFFVERIAQAMAVRDVFGNPFHSVLINTAWLAWNDGVVVRLGQAAYEQRNMPEGTLDKSLLAILADALEEAGCTDMDILGHCRQQGEHVRGCWVVDLILGKD